MAERRQKDNQVQRDAVRRRCSARREHHHHLTAFETGFLLHLGDHEVDKVAADLAPNALIVISRQRDGQWTNTEQSGDDWIAAMKRSTTPTLFREPLTHVTVTIDSDHLAYLRADFQVVRDGKALSHGVDQFTLTREAGAWKIAAVAYTSSPIR